MPNENSFCILPWVSIEANSIGEARPCCLYEGRIAHNDGRDFNMKSDTISEAYNSDYMKNLRQRFINGERPEECAKCWREEAAGRISKRINSVSRLEEMIGRVDYTSTEADELIFLDLKLGNICNLACRVCASWSSSKLAKEELSIVPPELHDTHPATVNFRNGQWPRNAVRFWDDLKTLIPRVKYFEFTGGEPFLIKQHFDILEYAVKEGYAGGIEVHYNTNGTTFPEQAYEIWPFFKMVEVAFSIDNLEERFEFERKGAIWSETLDVIDQVDAMKDRLNNMRTQICLTVNAQNVYYLPEICDWINKQDFTYHFFNMLHDPFELNIGRMTDEAKQLVRAKLAQSTFTPAHKKQIENILRFMDNGQSTDGSAFCARVTRHDTYRNEDFSELYPEIAKAMGYSRER